MKIFDVTVIGGGHAGIEAAYMASHFNLNIALITLPDVPIGSAACNPAVGGVSKGQVVREIDALGGAMGLLADKAGIQYRTLNASKGQAVQSTRVQIDKVVYAYEAEKLLLAVDNIEIIRNKLCKVEKLDNYFSVKMENGDLFFSKKLIVTTGTFLNGTLHVDGKKVSGGRINLEKSDGGNELFSFIKLLDKRFKTGTPPRINIQSIDFDKLEKQPSDAETENFHWENSDKARNLDQKDCYITYTNSSTMKVIRENKDKSPMFNGQIQGVGPRYCPSIEDKAFRYLDRDVHHIFIEPESHSLSTWYPNGVSTSLPLAVQEEFLRTIVGLEKVEIEIPGYAVEYDVVDTSCLEQTLEHKSIKGIYFAGQVNGTSGYEEAAGQGLVAGINAACSLLMMRPFILNRKDSYIGVMIEDLVLNQRDEPYRLFSARAENRLFLREDNVFIRMYEYRKMLNLNQKLDSFYETFIYDFNLACMICDSSFASISSETAKLTMSDCIRKIDKDSMEFLKNSFLTSGLSIDDRVLRCVTNTKRYESFIKKAFEHYQKIDKLDSMSIDWNAIANSQNVAIECRQRISKSMPKTFGQLKLIEGIRPATLSIVVSKLF